MPSAVTVTPRKLFKEDLQLTTSPSAPTSNQTVLGLGTVALNPIDAVLYSAFPSAASDQIAHDTYGVGKGYLYYNTTTGKLKTQMTHGN